ncbi:efflux RND transporter periplasmic adaptor subunit [Roseateles sp. So40a]|uniref:efflux RND transporter periplasmic adaptor subunit n=1 Tax=Roseateles sp. So40a TaxID=3400226 RepID=UPI003A841ED9
MKLTRPTTWIALSALAAALVLAYAWQRSATSPATSPAAVTASEPAAATATKSARSATSDSKPDQKPADGPVPVEARPVERLALADEAQAVGSLRARQSVLLRPEVSGRVVKLGFSDGQRVRAGQLLVQLEDSLQAAQLKQAEAQAGIARTQLQRNRELLTQGFVSANAVDQSQAALDVAEAQVALARAQVQRMQVRAPFDGVAGIRSVNLGDYVKDGADLVGIEDASSMWVDFRLPERYVPRLRTGQTVELALDALPQREFRAQVEAVDAQLDANGRSMLVRARLTQVAPELRSGLFARVKVRFALREQAIVVPEEALVPQGGKQYVLKVVPQGATGSGRTTQRIEARLGLRVPGKVEILDGLAHGDLVVTAGQQRLMRGDAQAIQVVELGGRT